MTNIDILWIHEYLNRKYGMLSAEKQETEIHQYGFYLLRAIPLLEEYRKLSKQKSRVLFSQKGRSAETTMNMQALYPKVQETIRSYIQVVQTFFSEEYYINEWDKLKYEGMFDPEENYFSDQSGIVSSSQKKGDTSQSQRIGPSQKKCVLCQSEAEDFHIYENHWVCPCGFVSNATHSTSSYKDIERINVSSKYMYDRRIHFRDCIYQYQGKQNAKIHPDIYEELKQQFVLHGIIPENYAQLSKEEAFQNVTKEHVMLFLKEIKQTKHYEDLTLIHYELTGKPTPDISHLETQLLSDFDVLVETYDRRYKHLERKNFINTQYVLFQLLRKHKFPCKKEDFNMLKTVDRKYFHDNICSELFAEIGWSFTAIF